MVTLDIDTARKVLAAQPFSVLLGARVEVFEKGRAILAVPIREDLKQQNGFLHGGVLAYAADNAITFAAGTTLGPEVLTSGVTISYVRPASGTTLLAEAEVTYTGRRQAVCRCDLYAVAEDGAQVLSAVAQGSVLCVS
ncbi:PaaI family thioesterase [Catenulispora sp. NF23]|uniref:Medium/long-chain acyl-CoA thioesterase YigI n=1 Tax=Catenulispora pinistramenti TaxID=2705254 RepID=A0ABS5KT77_9ACTN|nr:PaaI family thioesterase [Catenulispora pinistramenti]MBS2534206.1 PaaI family thioesterase [Catenulispora pinistramenti]MBS2549248.1 PaaI family thioesterase [Catenulispora pinistramenti]